MGDKIKGRVTLGSSLKVSQLPYSSIKLPRPQVAHDGRAVPNVGGGVELAPLLGQLLREGRADEAACAARGAGTGEGVWW